MSLSPAEQQELAALIERDGWAVTPPVVPQLEVDRLMAELELIAAADAERSGGRNLFEVSAAVRALARSLAVRSVAEAVLGAGCFAVKATMVDESTVARHGTPWRQSATIAVKGRVRAAGYGPWSEGAEGTMVRPPAEVLERMLALHVYLEDCGAGHGPVLVLPGSHRVGTLSPAAIESWGSAREGVACLVERGGVLAMRPLLLHATSPATRAARRRVVRLAFASGELGGGVEWERRVE